MTTTIRRKKSRIGRAAGTPLLWIYDILTSFLGCTIIFIIFGLCDSLFFDIIYNNARFQKKLLDSGMTLSSFSIIAGGIASAIGLILGKIMDILIFRQIRMINPFWELLSQVCGLMIAAFLYVALSTYYKKNYLTRR